MQLDFEERIVRNPALGAVLIWQFCRDVEQVCRNERLTSLPELSLALTLASHEPTVRKVRRMRFDTGLARAVFDEPEMTLGLQRRLEDSFDVVMRALFFATAARFVERVSLPGLPQFRCVRDVLPDLATPNHQTVTDMQAAIRRFANWIAKDGLSAACIQLQVRF